MSNAKSNLNLKPLDKGEESDIRTDNPEQIEVLLGSSYVTMGDEAKAHHLLMEMRLLAMVEELRHENGHLRDDLELLHLTALAAQRKVPLTKAQEREILKAQSEKIRQRPEYGRQMLIGAGILGEDGKLTEHYRRNEDIGKLI